MLNLRQKRLESKNKNINKDGKWLYKLINYTLRGKTGENLRNRIDVRLVSNWKDYLKWMTKSIYISQKQFGNDLVTTRKSKAIHHSLTTSHMLQRVY